MQQLLTWDEHLFRLINNGMANPFFDFLMPWLRNAEFWAPLYLYLAAFAVCTYKKRGWLWILFFIATVTLTDTVSSKIIKEYIWRERPFNNPALEEWVRVLVHKPINSSFTSSHAANHFGAAAFIAYTLKPVWGKWVYIFYAWAAVICLAQVYVGVHYPFDVTCGSIVGFLLGYGVAKAFNKYWGIPVIQSQPACW